MLSLNFGFCGSYISMALLSKSI